MPDGRRLGTFDVSAKARSLSGMIPEHGRLLLLHNIRNKRKIKKSRPNKQAGVFLQIREK